MKILALLALMASNAHAITVNPASAVTADSANTPLTIPYRDANGAFQMGALTTTGITNSGDSTVSTMTVSGNLIASSYTYVFARTATGFILPSGVDTKINFNTATNDTMTEFNTTTASGTFTAKFGGCYSNSATFLTGESETSGDIFKLHLYKNGSVFLKGPRFIIGAATNASASFNGTVKLAAGDTLDMRVFHNHGADVTLIADNTSNWWTIVRVPCP